MKLIFENLKLKTQILNENEKIKQDSEIVIINSFGVLQDFFLNAKSVFVGKSMIEKFKNDSGQNPMEAAKLNCKVYHGPFISNFREIYDILKSNNISFRIHNVEELTRNLIGDLQNPIKEWDDKSNTIKILSSNILRNSMKIIYNFLNVKN